MATGTWGLGEAPITSRAAARVSRLDYPRVSTLALGATAGIGMLVAYAPVLPLPVRSPLLAVGLVIWAGAAFGCFALGARVVWRALQTHNDIGVMIVAGVGICLAIIAAIQVELIQTVLGHPWFTWSWRWDLGHAQAIARTGGLDHALDYAGVPIRYHVGVPWLAAAVQRETGHGLTHVLFGVVPLLSVVSLVIGALELLRSAGIRYRFGAIAVALALTVPMHDRTALGVYYGIPGAFVLPQTWPLLGTKLMLNSLLGLAVGMTSVALLVPSRAGVPRLVLSILGLASLTQTKPQYFAAFGLFAGILGLARIVNIRNRNPRNALPLAVALAALALGLVHLTLLPGDVAWFATPQWRAAATRGLFREPLHAYSYVIPAALAAWYLVRPRDGGHDQPSGVGLLLVGAATAYALAGLFYLVRFPFRTEFTARWFALGFPPLPEALAGDKDLAQSLEAARLLVLVAGFGILATSVQAAGAWWRRSFELVAAALVLTPIPLLTLGFVHPPAAYAVAEDEDLRATLAEIPQRATLLIANDLADPAQNYVRPLQGMLLTAYAGHAFYVANLRYIHYAEPDAVARLGEVRSFFGAPWSDWHTAWLVRSKITHVLVHDRCRPPWLGQTGLPLRPLRAHGRWRAFAVVIPADLTSTARQPPAADPHPTYGAADCLSGRSGADSVDAGGT